MIAILLGEAERRAQLVDEVGLVRQMLLVLENLGLMLMQLSFQLLYLHCVLIDSRSGAGAMRFMVFGSLTDLRIFLQSQAFQL